MHMALHGNKIQGDLEEAVTVMLLHGVGLLFPMDSSSRGVAVVWVDVRHV